jgi:outer membrane protein
VHSNALRVVTLALIGLLATTAVHAQDAAANPTPNIRVINMMQAISSTAEGRKGAADLQAQFLSRQQELESMQKQIGELQKRLNGQPPLSDEETARVTAQGTQLEQRLERKKNEYQEDLSSAQSEIVNAIGRKMVDVLERYAQEHSLVGVLDSSAQNTPILYASKNIDVTEEIVHLYDQAHPITTAAATPAKPVPTAKAATPTATSPK